MWNEAPEDFQPNDAGGISFLVKSADLDGPLSIDGINRITCTPNGPNFSTTKVASGMETLNELRTYGGKVEVEISDSSTSMTTLSMLANLKKAVSFVHTDPVSPELNVSCGYARLEMHPATVRSEETNMTVWVFVCPVMKQKTGGFTINVTE